MLFTFMYKHSQSIPCDQNLLIRHFLTHPDLYYLDNEQYFTITSQKNTFFNLPKGRALSISPELSLQIKRANDSTVVRNIAIFHANNKNSNLFYEHLVQQYNQAVEVYVGAEGAENNASMRIREIWRRADSLHGG